MSDRLDGAIAFLSVLGHLKDYLEFGLKSKIAENT
jgi:hypothetical protein